METVPLLIVLSERRKRERPNQRPLDCKASMLTTAPWPLAPGGRAEQWPKFHRSRGKGKCCSDTGNKIKAIYLRGTNKRTYAVTHNSGSTYSISIDICNVDRHTVIEMSVEILYVNREIVCRSTYMKACMSIDIQYVDRHTVCQSTYMVCMSIDISYVDRHINRYCMSMAVVPNFYDGSQYSRLMILWFYVTLNTNLVVSVGWMLVKKQFRIQKDSNHNRWSEKF